MDPTSPIEDGDSGVRDPHTVEVKRKYYQEWRRVFRRYKELENLEESKY